MSLRARLLMAIMLALLLSFGVGAALATWQAARSVRIELAAAMAGARTSAAEAIAAIPADATDADAASGLRLVTHSLDGNRHIRAELQDAGGQPLLASRLAADGVPPRWFLAVVAPALPRSVLQARRYTLVLSADATNEALERWDEMRGEMALLALFCVAAASLCSLTAARALRPLIGLSHAIARLGRGECCVRLPSRGPPEIASLAGAFNTLAGALETARDRNLQLQSQVTLLAEEERAEIARDLHDEVGPLLFAITAFTATIGRLAAEGDVGGIPAQLRSIQDAASAIQLQVRDMLGRLHDVTPMPACLADQLDGLQAFWRRVQPGVCITLEIDAHLGELDGPAGETLFRVAQESVSNAIRHGDPRQVSVRLRGTDAAVLRVADDGSGGAAPAGYGVAGMRARMAAAGGALQIEQDGGWTVTATLPLGAAAYRPAAAIAVAAQAA